MSMAPFTIGDKPLDIATIEQISRQHRPVTLGGNARQRMAQAQQVVVDILSQPAPKPTYGINTGFGALADVSVKRSDLDALQLNLIRSHCTGVGEPLPTEATRALMLLRGAVLAKGRSGARPRLADLLCEFLNRGIHPVIPSRGSVGASGDLAPLAHLALSLIGEGTVEYQGQVRPSREVLDECNITPLTLQPKEGLTLINGTQLMAGLGSLTLADAQALCLAADVIGAMSLDGLLGTWAAFDERVVSARPHAGQVACGKRLISLLADSPIGTSHEDCGKVQDPYSLRCMPQVHGATADALAHCESVLVTEANSCTDNPLVFSEDGAIISGGNFHGQPVALALDYAAIATAELANISERRIEQLVNPHLSSGLPPFLTKHSGLQSGFMMAQVSAAALVSENKILCHPSSVDSIPSSASREDHVSMGATGALKFAQIVDHVTTVLAIELLCSAQAIDLRAPLKTSEPLQKVHKLVRQRIPALEEDRVLSGDIAAAKELVASRQLQQAALS